MKKFLQFPFLCGIIILLNACSNNDKNNDKLAQDIYFQPAIAPYTEAILLDSTDASLYYKRSLALSQIKKDSLALIDIEKAIKLDSQNPFYYSFQGELYNYIDDYDNALKAYNKAAELEPKDLRIQINIIKTLLYDDKVATAKAKVNHIIETIPDYPDAYYWDAMIKTIEKDTPQAIQILEKSLKLDPYFYESSLKLADIYAAIGSKNSIQQYLYTYSLDTNDIYPLYKIGDFYLQQNDYEKAKQSFLQSLQYDAEFTQSYIGLGQVLLAQDSIDKAKRTFYIASQTQPNNDEIYTYLGQIYEKLKIVDSAKLNYANALSINPKNIKAKEGIKRLKQ